MIVVTPLSNNQDYGNKKILFLAGPIQGADDWHQKVISDLADLDIVIANPKRESQENFNYSNQVDWESKYLAKADVIMFWLPNATDDIVGRSYAQTTRFELSEWLAKSNYNRDYSKIVLGIAEGFHGKRYIQKRLENTNVPVYDNYEDTIKHVRSLMQKSGRIFFTSDTHFASQRAFDFSRRPFIDVNDMNWSIIRNWNKLISDNDTIYHLGDFGDLEYAKYLKGNIEFVLGNYEQDLIKQNPQYLDCLKNCFGSVQENLIIELCDNKLNQVKIHLSHKPSTSKQDMYNAFGHIHGRQMIKKFGIDVGVDAHNYTPLSEDDFLFYKNASDNLYDEEVFL